MMVAESSASRSVSVSEDRLVTFRSFTLMLLLTALSVTVMCRFSVLDKVSLPNAMSTALSVAKLTSRFLTPFMVKAVVSTSTPPLKLTVVFSAMPLMTTFFAVPERTAMSPDWL